MKPEIKFIGSEELMSRWNCDILELIQRIKSFGLKTFHQITYPEALNGSEIEQISDKAINSDDFERECYMDSDFLLFRHEDILEFESKYSTSSVIQGNRDSEPSYSKVFPCPPGTEWEDIKITLVDNETVRIETPTGDGRFTYHELGLSDKRNNQPRKRLWPILIAFAQKQGVLSRGDIPYDPKLTNTAKRLNEHLKKLFGINKNIYKGHYKTYNGYHTRIFFSDQTYVVQQ